MTTLRWSWKKVGAAIVLGLGVALAACPVGGAGSDGGSSVPDAGPEFLPVDSYCEAAVDFFCPFYLRCGRIAETTPEACRTTFLESCNQVWEPRYRALADAELLRLSRVGLQACASHLAEIPCQHHLLDLEGPCRQIWRGRAVEDAPCGLGIESFICAPGLTCVLDLSFCGACRPLAAAGEDCGDGVYCGFPDACLEGQCVGPAVPGESCADGRNCIAGASCRSDQCVARDYVGVGDSCDADHRCPYRSSCIDSECLLSALLGQSCGVDTACASGTCDAQSAECLPLLATGAGCTDHSQCGSGRCVGDFCGAFLSACLD